MGKSIERSQVWFDPWLVCDCPAVAALVDRELAEAERTNILGRVRKWRQRDRQAFVTLVRSLVANAAHALALGLEPPTVGIPLANASGRRGSRYDGPGLGQLDAAMKVLSPKLVEINRSRRKGVASALTPGDELRDFVSALPSDTFGPRWFRRAAGGETIIVRRVERDDTNARSAVPVEYADNAETERYRAEVERINAALDNARIEFIGPEPTPDLSRRRLRHIFNTHDETPRFDLHGRLHGGWWQPLERERRRFIRIDGLPVADLDFSAMFLRLAYARAGLEPPGGDLYAGILSLDGSEDDGPARHRDGVKRVVNAMFSRVGPLTRLPRGSKALLPKGCSARSIREAILARHAPIREHFEIGLSMSLMRTESEILIAVLLRLIDLGNIVALPMHDGLMVREDCAETAERVMREVSFEKTGFELPVTRKSIVRL